MGCACLGRKALRARLNVCSFEAVACVPRAVGRCELLESRRETTQAVRCWQGRGLGRMLQGSRPLFSRFPLFSLQKGIFFSPCREKIRRPVKNGFVKRPMTCTDLGRRHREDGDWCVAQALPCCATTHRWCFFSRQGFCVSGPGRYQLSNGNEQAKGGGTAKVGMYHPNEYI